MKLSPLTSRKTACSLPTIELERNGQGWLLDGEIRQHSLTTLALRKIILDNLCWFLQAKKYSACGTFELKAFIVYLTRGHEEAGGRWGNPRQCKPVTASTVATYHRHLRTFFRWLVSEELLEASPMESVPSAVSRPDQIQPFTREHAILAYDDQPRGTAARRKGTANVGSRSGKALGVRFKSETGVSTPARARTDSGNVSVPELRQSVSRFFAKKRDTTNSRQRFIRRHEPLRRT